MGGGQCLPLSKPTPAHWDGAVLPVWKSDIILGSAKPGGYRSSHQRREPYGSLLVFLCHTARTDSGSHQASRRLARRASQQIFSGPGKFSGIPGYFRNLLSLLPLRPLRPRLYPPHPALRILDGSKPALPVDTVCIARLQQPLVDVPEVRVRHRKPDHGLPDSPVTAVLRNDHIEEVREPGLVGDDPAEPYLSPAGLVCTDNKGRVPDPLCNLVPRNARAPVGLREHPLDIINPETGPVR